MASDILTARLGGAPAPTAFTLAPPGQIDNAQRFGCYAYCLYLFLLVSRMPELFAARFGTSLYQVLIVSGVCLALLMTGGAKRHLAWGTLTAWLMALHVWYTLSIPFSYWKTGSVNELMGVLRYLPAFFFSAALIHNARQMRWAFATMCAAMLIVLGTTLTAEIKQADDGRLSLAEGSFANANEIALFLEIGMPFWAYFSGNKKTPAFLRLLIGAQILVSIYQCLRTGSRGGLVTLAALGLLAFFVAPGLGRLKILFAGALVALLLIPLMPSNIKDRLATIFEPARDSSATESTRSRMELLLEGIQIAITHPVTGIGIGVYPEAAAEISASKGERKRWQVPHNSYAQVASEAGLPALAFYIATLAVAVKAMWRTRRFAMAFPEMSEAAGQSTTLLIVMLIYILNNFFGNNATSIFYYVLCGLVLSCGAIAERDFRYYSALRESQANAGLNPRPAPEPRRRRFGPAALASQQLPASANTDSEKKDWTNQYGDAPWARRPPRQR